MRFLVDGRVPAPGQPIAAAGWWRELLPGLVASLRGHDLFLLSCEAPDLGSEPQAPACLTAPPVDAGEPAAEDRRLAALCRELGVDGFLSLCETSGGAQVATLVVIPPSGGRSGPDASVLALGSRFVVFSADDEARLRSIGAPVRRLERSPLEAVASAIGAALVEAAAGGEEGAVTARRRRVEEQVAAAARRGRQRSLRTLRRTYGEAQPPRGLRRVVRKARSLARKLLLLATGRPSRA